MKTFNLKFLILSAILTISATVTANSGNLHKISKQEMLERFLSYLTIDSQSRLPEYPGEFPMTDGQHEMAIFLAEEIRGYSPDINCIVSQDNYVYVTIPSNLKKGEDVPTLGFSCHLDVTPECVSTPVKPSVLIKYQGEDIRLSESKSLRTDTPEGKDLPGLVGKTIVHTDGNTLLGGDDKCGCTILSSVIKTIVQSERFRHGEIQFVFCPNEDIGMSAERIDREIFNPDILFDFDGEGGCEVTEENFSARGITIRLTGHEAHPAYAKALAYGDALAAASHFISFFPLDTRPENTEGKQGYIHPWGLEKKGDAYEVYIRIRFFSKEDGERFSSLFTQAIEHVRTAFPNVVTEVVSDDVQYDNVAWSMHPESHNILNRASAETGIEIVYKSERAGTTAAMFCAKGMTGGMCLFSGQHAPHTVYEYAVLEEMYDSYILALNIINETARE